jgi:hypothetical protein
LAVSGIPRLTLPKAPAVRLSHCVPTHTPKRWSVGQGRNSHLSLLIPGVQNPTLSSHPSCSPPPPPLSTFLPDSSGLYLPHCCPPCFNQVGGRGNGLLGCTGEGLGVGSGGRKGAGSRSTGRQLKLSLGPLCSPQPEFGTLLAQ